jgi:hypothetical protein
MLFLFLFLFLLLLPALNQLQQIFHFLNKIFDKVCEAPRRRPSRKINLMDHGIVDFRVVNW